MPRDKQSQRPPTVTAEMATMRSGWPCRLGSHSNLPESKLRMLNPLTPLASELRMAKNTVVCAGP
jgi:hypothetical protein